MNPVEFFVNRFRVTIHLNRLVCNKEYDASGHSEPYIWPAFFRADASTFVNLAAPVDIQVPFESESGHGIFGEAGKNVRPGDIIPIPDNFGRYVTTVQTFRIDVNGDGIEEELVLVGFAIVLLEEDETPGDAIRAGHQAFAQALRDEIHQFAITNLRFPNQSEIEAIKETVSNRVKDAIKDKLSWWDKLWCSQDDFISFLGGEDTLFTAERIRYLSGKGSQGYTTPIRGTETVLYPSFPIPVPVEMEHDYDLYWQIEVEPLGLELAWAESALFKKVEGAGKKLQQLDTAIRELGNKLRGLEVQKGSPLFVEFEEKVKRMRPKLVRELALAWKRFVRPQRGDDANQRKPDPN